MSNSVSVDFHFSIQTRGRGAKKRLVEGNGEPAESQRVLERIPRISRYMAIAIHFEDLIRRGIVTDYADLARLGHVTRARVTQIMNLRLLAPEIQEVLLESQNLSRVHLRMLQRIAVNYCWKRQQVIWKSMERQNHTSKSISQENM